MTWVAVAVAAAGVLGAGASAYAANKQSSAIGKAAKTQADMFNTINGQEQPFMKAGYGATSKLSQLLGIGTDDGSGGYGSLASSFTPADYLANKDPGYDFQLKTGAQALRNADTPGVGSLSGAALKDLIGFNQGMAATGYQNAFNRFQTQQGNVFNRLSQLANLGQNAASNTGKAGVGLGTGVAQAQAAQGAAQAGGIVGAGNSLGNAGISAAYLLGQNNNPGGTQGWATGINNGTFDSAGNYYGRTPADLAGDAA